MGRDGFAPVIGRAERSGIMAMQRGEKDGQAGMAAEKEEAEKDARFSGADGDGRWAEDTEAEAAERSEAPHRLRKHSRRVLTRKADFDRVLREGRTYKEGNVVLVVERVENETAWKLGLLISRRKGKAVRRNRFRRCVREWFRKHSERIPAGRWYVVIPQGSIEYPLDSSLYQRLEALILRVAGSMEGGRA